MWQWGSLFPNVALVSALPDQLLHHATTITIRGDSYRLKDNRRAGVFQPLDPAPSGLQQEEAVGNRRYPVPLPIAYCRSEARRAAVASMSTSRPSAVSTTP